MNLHEELIATVEGWDVDEIPAIRHCANEIRKILIAHTPRKEAEEIRRRAKALELLARCRPIVARVAASSKDAAGMWGNPAGAAGWDPFLAEIDAVIADRDIKPDNAGTCHQCGRELVIATAAGLRVEVCPVHGDDAPDHGSVPGLEEAPPFEPGSILETIAKWRHLAERPPYPSVTEAEKEKDEIAADLFDILEALVNATAQHGELLAVAAVASAVEARLGPLERNVAELKAEIAKLLHDRAVGLGMPPSGRFA